MTKNERRKDSSFQGLGNWPAWFFRFPVWQPVRPRLAKTCWAGIRTRRGDKQSHQRERRSNAPGLHFERARRRREKRDPFGWIRDHLRGTKAWHRSVLHVEARDRALPSETNFLFPRRGEVKALGREESRDEGYAAPNPARTRRGSVRRDRRSRYVRVLAPVARRNAARFTRSRPVQPRPHPCAPPKAVDKLTNNGARDDDNPTLTSTPVPNLRSRMRVPYELRRLCGRHNLRMVRDRDRPSSANPDRFPPGPFFSKGPLQAPEVKFSPPPPLIRSPVARSDRIAPSRT